MKTGVVTEFKGEYAFLSNFYMADFAWRNEIYPSAEHAFSAAKGWYMLDFQPAKVAQYDINVRNAPTPGAAKGLGRRLRIDVDAWDAAKVQVMREIVHAKFKEVPGLAGQLINTGAMLLVEGNDWNDTFWGRCGGKGFNTLGAILMEERGYWLRGNP